MAQQVFGPAAVVSVLNRAFTNTSPSNAVFANQVATAGTTDASQLAFAKSFGAQYAVGKTAADLSALLMTNMGLDNALLAAALTDYIAANGTENVGIIAWQLSSILSNLENDATYGAAAKAWNAEVTDAYQYSSDVTNTVPSSGGTTGNEASKNFVLTVGQDVRTGGAGADFFRGVAGNPVGAQEQTTFNSSDILDGGAGTDSLILNLVGNYNGGARVKNIEILKLGQNVGGNIQFDYNVNAGFNEISEVTTIVADQINAGEALTVNNIVRTVDGDARVLPTLSWENDSNTGLAGVVNYGYRAAELTGTADTQIVSLDSVNNGTLNLAAGIETVTLRSVAGERVTLLNSTNADTGTNAVAADIISSGTLTRVNIEAAAEVGKVGGRVAGTGLVDRVATDGVGRADAGTTANLLSVGARVTTVDANTSTANVNVQFLAKTDGAATNVTFTGGAGNDYAEFEIGNVSAAGGAGNDVFAFVTQRAGATNSTFGSGDSIVGGAGNDVVQLGDNGVGNYNVASSEFLNKSGIDTLDLRGAVNTVSLSSGFVAGTDGAALVVTTDNMVVGTKSAALSNAEYNSTNTIDLRELDQGQALNFVGGQGSDRIVLDNEIFTSALTLNGGDNTDNGNNAVAGRYDTLTVVNSAVIDRTDLSNVSGFEGMVLNKNTTGAATFNIELTEAFLLANTQAIDSGLTSIDDQVFQIGTAAGVDARALGAGDTVRIDVTDLFTVNNNTAKASLVARNAQVDVTTLVNAGVAVQYVYNGTQYANLAALQAAVAFVGGAVLTGNDAAGQTGVIGAAVALPPTVTGVVFSSGIGAQAVLGTNNDDTFTLTQADTVTGGTGADTVTFNAGSGNAQVVLGAGADTVNLNAAITSATGFLQMNGGGTLNVNTAVGNMNANPADYVLAAGTTVEVNVAQAGMTLESSALTVNANAGGTFTLGAAAQTFNGVGNFVDTVTTAVTAATQTVNTGDGADIVNVVVGTTGTVNVNAGAGADAVNIATVNGATYNVALGDGADTVRINNAAIAAADVNTVTVSDFNVGTDVLQSWVAGASIVTGAFVTANAAAANKITAQTTGNVIEILSTGVDGVQIANPTNDASVLASLNQVLVGGGVVGDIANGNYTVIGYQGANAYVYQIAIAGANGTAGGDDLVELIGVLSNVGADAINAINIA